MNTEAARIAIKIRLTEIGIKPDSASARRMIPHLLHGAIMACHTKAGRGDITILHRPTKNKK